MPVPAVILLWAFWIEPDSLVNRQVRVEMPGWHAELRVAVLSDLHIGSPHVGLDKLRLIVERTNAEKPELIVLLGDYVIGGPNGSPGIRGGQFVQPEPIAQELKNLRAPLGVFAVLGNHDWWYDGERVGHALTGAGITVLENRAVRIGADPFWLAGIADLWTRNPDIAGTLAQVTDDSPVVLITHNPDLFPDVPSRVNLTIAAHTHGGQVNLPFYGPPFPPSELGYTRGRVADQQRQLFITSGIGTSIIPVRFRVPPEIVILTLTR